MKPTSIPKAEIMRSRFEQIQRILAECSSYEEFAERLVELEQQGPLRESVEIARALLRKAPCQ